MNCSTFVLQSAGFSLRGHAISDCKGKDVDCGLRCLRNDRCRSYNCFPAQSLGSTQMCHLNNETRRSKPKHFLANQGVTYFEVQSVLAY